MSEIKALNFNKVATPSPMDLLKARAIITGGGALGGGLAGATSGAIPGAIAGGLTAEEGQGLEGAIEGAGRGALYGGAIGGLGGAASMNAAASGMKGSGGRMVDPRLVDALGAATSLGTLGGGIYGGLTAGQNAPTDERAGRDADGDGKTNEDQKQAAWYHHGKTAALQTLGI